MRILIISDTHTFHNNLKLPNNIDTIIHCGDFTSSIRNNLEETMEFINWYDRLKIKNKILIPGNHELYLEYLSKANLIDNFFKKFPSITYLDNKSIVIDNIKFYGIPNCEYFEDWAFHTEKRKLEDLLNNIDEDTNILITHSPSHNVLDYTDDCENVGSRLLKTKIQKLKYLKYHVCGHIHEDNGIKKNKNYTSINAALFYNLNNYHIIEI